MKRRFAFICLLLTAAFGGHAMEAPSDTLTIERADSLRIACRFDEARAIYQSLKDASRDSSAILSLNSRILCCENAVAMSDFVHEPTVVAKHKFSLKDFFLYYPMEDKSWRMAPNVLDSIPGKLVTATYVPEDATEIYFSKKGKTGFRNIYRTSLNGSLWRQPELINEGLTSTADDIFPVVSSDGKKLTFASAGLYGVGGYDLYVSTWNEERKDWDEPVNMGFPYSSQYDDFLYMDTPDGKYTIFASNRECSRDSVCVYVLEFDNVPVGKQVHDPDRLREILSLTPSDKGGKVDNGTSVSSDIPENDETRKYVDKMEQVRAMKDSVNRFSASLDAKRQQFAISADDDERDRLTAEILEGEAQLPKLQSELGKANAELQKIEMDFLFRGVIIDPDKLVAKADRQVVGKSAAYTFTKMNPGDPLRMSFEKPVVKFDYSFKVLPEGRMAEDQTLPDGIIYQIHFITLPTSATKHQLKGLSPVYETVQPNGYHVYRVGVFTRYADALDNLNTVKGVGFRSASVVAFNNGKSVSLAEARAKEDSREFWQVTINTGSDTMPAEVADAIRENCAKDIAKVWSDGIVLFVVSPFESQDEAEVLESTLRSAGVENVSVSRMDLSR